MATDDPGTPGDGKWEVNLGAIGTKKRDAWNVDVPDADINYGLGDRIQLNLDLPWTYTNAGGRWRAGVGDTSVGVKWRFLDKEQGHGIELSMYPRYETSLSNYSERIGVASPDRMLVTARDRASSSMRWAVTTLWGHATWAAKKGATSVFAAPSGSTRRRKRSPSAAA